MLQIIITIVVVLFWCSIAVLLYSYLLYPLLLPLLARTFGRPARFTSGNEPTIAVMVPVYNEAKVIEGKLRDILSCDYPPDKLSVWVGSDCSDDGTDDIVGNCGDTRVHLWRSPVRSGKAGILNRLVVQADAEIIVFTDADIRFERNSLRVLAGNFADPAVGGVGGHTIQRKSGMVVKNEEMRYRAFEASQKMLEARLNSTISAFGSFYAIRKSLFVPFHPHTYSNDDVMMPMNIIRQGYRMYFDIRAVSYEEAVEQTDIEFGRRVRISAGNFQAFFWLLDFLNPFRGWPWFCYVSHKVTRWFSPLILLIALVCCGLVAFGTSLVLYKIFLAFGFLTLVLGLLHKIMPLPYGHAFFYFLVMNIAVLFGFFRFLRGIRSAVWARTERR
ncbi:MAG: glycosyltransferase family 2 protein [Chitinispirillaceae bacterium]|nr:glycosyltransferase family 2 protein [Chitinispirillaceae bacterium]